MGALVRPSSALLLLAAGLTLSAAPAPAATFTVNTTIDASDANTSDGTCATAGGQCSLRAAIEEANNFIGADVIALPAGEYHLTLGQLTISDSATVEGAGAATTIIDQDTFARIFHLAATAAATISGVTIRGGATPGEDGGGIVNLGSLTLLGVAVLDNNAGVSGGGIQSTLSTSSLTIDNSTISGNRASDGTGGGIDFGSMGSLAITNSTITNNWATQDGGGIYVSSMATISSTTITGNRADSDASGSSGDGGGVFVATGGAPILRGSIVANNIDASLPSQRLRTARAHRPRGDPT